ncbi:Alpha/Beta hydrolase protein [Irpex lacteus]|nr:Alpha/Beta hydrolase protein [Irpex lacteus]
MSGPACFMRPTTTGHAPFTLQNSSSTPTYQTFYKIYGSLTSPSAPRPLIILHGGPGSTHDYVLPLVQVLHTTYGIPLIFYDQLGSGESTHLPEKKGDEGKAFWTEEVFMDQLDSLILFLGLEKEQEGGGYDVLGHSWGGMLAMRNSPASMELFVQGALKLREKLPEDIRNALNTHEAAGTTDSEEYHAAEHAFYGRHLCRMAEDSTVYLTMNGPSEFFITGTLKTWSIIPDLLSSPHPRSS